VAGFADVESPVRPEHEPPWVVQATCHRGDGRPFRVGMAVVVPSMLAPRPGRASCNACDAQRQCTSREYLPKSRHVHVSSRPRRRSRESACSAIAQRGGPSSAPPCANGRNVYKADQTLAQAGCRCGRAAGPIGQTFRKRQARVRGVTAGTVASRPNPTAGPARAPRHRPRVASCAARAGFPTRRVRRMPSETQGPPGAWRRRQRGS
jgi:hypothetical protein